MFRAIHSLHGRNAPFVFGTSSHIMRNRRGPVILSAAKNLPTSFDMRRGPAILRCAQNDRAEHRARSCNVDLKPGYTAPTCLHKRPQNIAEQATFPYTIREPASAYHPYNFLQAVTYLFRKLEPHKWMDGSDGWFIALVLGYRDPMREPFGHRLLLT